MLAVVVNQQLLLQFDPAVALPGSQMDYLSKLDTRFEQGVVIEGKQVDNPQLEDRARFIVTSMMEGIMYREEAQAAACLAWLGTRLPALKQVVAEVDEQGTRFELVFDRDYQPHVSVDFTPRPTKKT